MMPGMPISAGVQWHSRLSGGSGHGLHDKSLEPLQRLFLGHTVGDINPRNIP